jgi:hypothetical protein
MARASLVSLASAVLVLTTSPAVAQSSIEVFGGLTVTLSPPAGSYEIDYEPKLIFGTATGGQATHTLTLDTTGRAGFEFGVNWLPTKHAGLQLLVDRMSHTLGGSNPDYQLALDYLARLPPDYVQLPYSAGYSLRWPDTSGEMTVWRVGANGLARFGGRPVDLTISGGLMWSRVSGVFEQAGYYDFHLGGHSVLFYNDVLLDMRFAEGWHLGYDLGIDAGFHVGGHAALLAGVRFFGPSLEPDVLIGDTLNSVNFEVPPADIEAALGRKQARFDPWGSPMLRVGLRVGF